MLMSFKFNLLFPLPILSLRYINNTALSYNFDTNHIILSVSGIVFKYIFSTGYIFCILPSLMNILRKESTRQHCLSYS